MSENYDIKIGFDASKAEKGLDTFDKGIQAVLRGMGKLDKTAASAFGKLDKAASGVSFGDLAKAAGRATAAVNRTAKAAGDAGGSMSRLAKHTTDLTRDLKAAEVQANKTAAALARIGGGSKRGRPPVTTTNLPASAVKDATSVAKLATQQQKLATATNQTSTAAQHLAKASTQAAIAQANLATAQTRTTTAATAGAVAAQKLAQQTALAAASQQKLATAQQQTARATAQAQAALTNARAATVKLATAQTQGNNASQRGATLSVKHATAQQQHAQSINNTARSYHQQVNAQNRAGVSANQLTMSQMRLAKQQEQARKEASLMYRLMNGNMFGKANAGARGATTSMRGLENAFSASYQAASLFRTAIGAITLGSLVSSIQKTSQLWSQFRMTIDATATSASEAGEQQQFLLDMVKRVPVPLAQAAEGFRKFSVGARMSGVTVKETQTMFEGLSTAFVGLGATPEQMDRAMLAFSQMMSKGTVMAEELKGQMAEAIAGAGPLMAKAMDMTMGKLAKTMQAGMLKSKEALPLFVKTLRETFEDQLPSALNTSGIQMVKFQNNMEVFKMNVAKGGFETGLVAALQSINSALESDKFADVAEKIGQGFGDVFEWAGAAATALAQNIDTVIAAVTYLAATAALLAAFSIVGTITGAFMGLVGVIGTVGRVVMALAVPFRVVAAAAGLANFSILAIPLSIAAIVGVGLVGLAKLDEAFGVLTDSINWMRDKARAALDPMLAGMVVLGGVSQQYLDEFRKNSDDVDKRFKGVGKSILSSADGLWDSLKGMVPSMDQFTPDMQQLIDSFNNAKTQIERNAIKIEADKKGIADLDRYAEQARDQAKNIKDNADEAAELTKRQQKLFDQISPLTKARKEYEESIKLLDDLEARGKAGTKGGITAEQRKALQERYDYLTLDDRDPYKATVRGLEDEMKLLKLNNSERDVERQVMQTRNDLIKKGYANAEELAESLRKTFQYMGDMEKGGSNGFQRWSNSLKDFRESLIDVEQNALEGLSDQLTDLVTEGKADFASLGQSILRSINKAIIDKMMKNVIDSMNIGKDGILGSLFGQKSVGEDEAKKVRDDAVAKGLPESTVISDLMEVTAGTVNINGEALGPWQPGKGFGNGPGQGAGYLNDALRGDTSGSLRDATTSATAGLRGSNDNSAASLREMTTTATKAATTSAVKAAANTNSAAYGGAGVNPAGAGNDPNAITGGLTLGGIGSMFSVGSAAAATMPSGGVSNGTNGKTLNLTQTDIYDLKKTLMTEWAPGAGEAQAKGIVDTILNRQASGKWGSTTAQVVNAKSQFSDINGPVAWGKGRDSVSDISDSELMSGKGLASSKLVDKYLRERASGAASIVGDNLNYANPNYSSAKNLGWINALDGPRLGKGDSTHIHGTTPDLQKNRPGAFNVSLPGMGGSGGGAAAQLSTTLVRNEKELAGVNTDLQAVVRRANQISKQPFMVGDGMRTIDEQRENVRKGYSKTMNSRHLKGEAVDLWAVDGAGKPNWDKATAPGQMTEISKAMKQASQEMGVPIEWGGDWKGSWDKPHYQLGKGYKGGKYPNGMPNSDTIAGGAGQAQAYGGAGLDMMTTGSVAQAPLRGSAYGVSAMQPVAQAPLRGSVDMSGLTAANSSITTLNASAQTLSTTASSQLRPSITDLSNQTTMAGASAQQASAGIQSFASPVDEAGNAVTMTAEEFRKASEAVRQAGMNASSVSPAMNAFGGNAASSGVQLAGLAKQTAAVGAQAQQSTGGLSGLFEGIGSLFSKLTGGGGGGGLGSIMGIFQQAGSMFGLFSEGGVSTKPVSMGSTSSISAWGGAPKYAQGTAEAQRAPGTPKMHGGFPAVLHDNEAVIPLTRGRSVPVEMGGGDKQVDRAPRGDVYMTIVTPDANSFRKSKTQVQGDLAAAQNRSALRNS